MKFEKQTYTQTPNSLFLMMKDMDECELKVVLLICRYTFGYHREEVKLSSRRIADEIGMNTASVSKGAERAIERGLIEKVIDGNKTTLWRALVSDSEIESQVIQKLNRGVSDNESLLGIKESNKEKSSLQEIQTLADRKVDAILEIEKQVHAKEKAGQGWRGREILMPDLLPYGDWWHKKTGLHMYSVKGKANLNKDWMKAFKEWSENELTVKSLEAAFEANKWRGVISTPLVLTKDAIAIQAVPVVENTQREEGKSSGYYA